MNRKYQHKVLLSMICAIVAACHKSEPLSPASYSCHPIANDSSHNHPHHQKYTHLLSELTQKGVPGITMSIHTPQGGTWIGAAGKADLYNKIAFQPCNITRVGSTVKMFTATTILILAEEGKVKLSDPISKYLPQTVLSTLKNANQSTIQQLLNHSSGIYNYIQNLQFQTGSLNDLPKIWQPEELLAYAQNKPAYFAPGSDSKYSNTNYILLGMLIEALEKKPFFKVFKEKLFKPLGLQYTRFAAEDPIPPGLVKGYIDLYGKLQLTESTYYSGWDYYTADGGLISTPYDLMQFLRALMDGKIISQENLDTMLTWNTPTQQNSQLFKLHYGLGIFKMDTPYGEVYYHSGDAIGYYANMMYVPSKRAYICYASNGNYGKIDALILTKDAIQHILKTVLE